VSNHGRDIVVLGYSKDVEALLRHLDVEAPAMLRRVIVIDPRPATRERLQGSGVEVRCEDPSANETLQNAAVDQATVVVLLSVPGTDAPGAVPAIVRDVRGLSRRVRVLALATDCAHGSELRLSGADEVFHLSAPDDLHRTLRRARRGRQADASDSHGSDVLGRLLSWRFAVLLAITIIDAIVFLIPLTASALIVAVVFAPHYLRRAARFLEDLAGPEAT
jgi:hypothetical protein